MFRQQIKRTTILSLLLIVSPILTFAQGIPENIHSLHSILEGIYDKMIPMCGKLIGVGRAIAAFGALAYISVRVWKHISHAEPVDFFPLFRPFCLLLVLIFFPYVIAMINGILKPTADGTAALVKESTKSIQTLLEEKERAIRESDTWKAMVGESGEGNYELWLKYAHQDAATNGEKWYEKILYSMQFQLSRGFYSMKNSVKQMVAEVLQIIYEAAALCINTMRTFNMIILAILGPLVVAFSVFDGFQHTLVVWLARYINVYLWLPIANIFGAITGQIMEEMIKIDIQQVNLTGDTFFSGTDIGYIIFMIIAIVGYSTVPNIAGHIINVGDRSALGDKISRMAGSGFGGGARMAGGVIGGPAGGAAAGMAADALVNSGSNTNSSFAGSGTSGGYFNNGGSGYQRGKIGGG